MEMIDIQADSLSLGSEIMYHPDILDKLASDPELRINGGSYILVEFPTNISIYDMRNAVTAILRKGFIPVIAHIEEYSEILKKPNFAWDIREYDALLHVNASSVAKMRFGKISKFLKFLFNKSYVDAVTLNAGDSAENKLILSKATEKITKLYGEEVAEKVLYSNPKAIFENKKLFRY